MNSKPFQTLRALALAVALLAMAGTASAQANFNKYVAMGDSLTAAFASGGLTVEVQERSYPALLAQRAGVTGFQQPLASAPGIPPLLAIQGFSNGSPIIAPRAAGNGNPLNLNLPRPYDNLAVPGFDTAEALNVVSDPANPLSDLVLRGLGTMLQQTLVQQPTFVTVWLGNNDVLGAATSGIVIDGVTLTRRADFRAAYRTILGAIAQSGAQMAVANIPDVTALPFVTTIPPVVVNPATRQPVIGPNGQPVPLLGPNGPLGPGDRVLLSASGLLAQGIGIPAAVGGTNKPLPDQVVLSAGEAARVSQRTNELNAEIVAAANDFGAALVDVNAFFDDVAAHGFAAGANIVYTTDFLTGGIFSYDGVHPTPFGYAVAANLFIDAINARFNDNIPQVDLLPFIFGPDGSAGSTIPSAGLGNGNPVFAPAAYNSLHRSLGLPPMNKLLRIKKRRGGDDGNNGNRGVDTPKRQNDAPRQPTRPAQGVSRDG